ncbi:protein ADM2 isoform X1 [Camelus ferus]|uniref:Protein ADM2 isoform X1 n=2 Tax=Camelus TaxID=9836 RepID=A0A8B7K6A8_CAMFR|nr:protein ADM2 isoform X1 [Camelus ferus]XP_045374306.1 protein ADM2 isoform X1 [Camelus bactrianus]
MALANTWVPTGPEPSSCVWAVCWAPAKCRISVTACGSLSGLLACRTPPLWTPAVPTAMAEEPDKDHSHPPTRLQAASSEPAAPESCPRQVGTPPLISPPGLPSGRILPGWLNKSPYAGCLLYQFSVLTPHPCALLGACKSPAVFAVFRVEPDLSPPASLE